MKTNNILIAIEVGSCKNYNWEKQMNYRIELLVDVAMTVVTAIVAEVRTRIERVRDA